MVESDGVRRQYRSIDPEYTDQIIREYEHWTLMINENQNYLGRMVVWLLRPGEMQRLSDLTGGELVELQKILKEAEGALENLWQPDHMNYAWLGNLMHMHGGHGHMHLIPRYSSMRSYRGRRFDDMYWGKNYPNAPAFKLEGKPLFLIRDAIKKALP